MKKLLTIALLLAVAASASALDRSPRKKKRDKKGGKRKDSGFVDAKIEGKDEPGSGLEVSPERFSSM